MALWKVTMKNDAPESIEYRHNGITYSQVFEQNDFTQNTNYDRKTAIELPTGYYITVFATESEELGWRFKAYYHKPLAEYGRYYKAQYIKPARAIAVSLLF